MKRLSNSVKVFSRNNCAWKNKARNRKKCQYSDVRAVFWWALLWHYHPPFWTGKKQARHEKCPNTEFFLVRIFLYLDWIQENTDQKKLRIWILFMHHAVKVWNGRGILGRNAWRKLANYISVNKITFLRTWKQVCIVVVLGLVGPRAENICGALVWKLLLTNLFFKLSLVKIIMPQILISGNWWILCQFSLN